MTILPQKLLGDCRETLKALLEKSVHCCVTSIPYWGLRSYLPKDHPLKPLEIGSEPTFELYLQHIVEAFRAVHRVLRDDGTLWLNVGDAYQGSGLTGGTAIAETNAQMVHRGMAESGRINMVGLASKNLLMMPARVAMALQCDGWYLRSQIPWIKRNAMPESVTDRPASAIEYVFLLSKSKDYFYDRYAVMMPVSAATNPRLSQKVMEQVGSERAHAGGKTNGRMKAVGGKVVLQGEGIKSNASFEGACSMPVSARNRRNTDWFMQSFQGLLTDEEGEPLALLVNPKGTTIQHFASYPPKLIEPLIKAGTSERGCCADCGAPWERMLSHQYEKHRPSAGNDKRSRDEDKLDAGRGHGGWQGNNLLRRDEHIGWQPTCECHGQLTRGKITIPARISKEDASAWGADTNGEYLGESTKNHASHGVQDASDVKARIIRNATEDRQIDGWIYTSNLPLDAHPTKPCTILDPFAGTSTTAEVATRLGRHSIMCELNPEYAEAAKQRDSQGGLALL
jgi:DNA modification methylase